MVFLIFFPFKYCALEYRIPPNALFSNTHPSLPPPGLVLDQWAPEGSVGVGVEQPEGCGRPGTALALDAHALMDADADDIQTIGEGRNIVWRKL